MNLKIPRHFVSGVVVENGTVTRRTAPPIGRPTIPDSLIASTSRTPARARRAGIVSAILLLRAWVSTVLIQYVLLHLLFAVESSEGPSETDKISPKAFRVQKRIELVLVSIQNIDNPRIQ